LGRIQMQQGNPDGARESFQQALTADDRFVDAYRELADLALKTKRWQELADDTAHVLQLDPQGSQYWYLNSAANYQLKQVDKAEKSALQGLRTDARQTIPQLQYLLAAILTLKHDYRGAAEHIRHYLRLAPHAENAAVAQQQLQQLEKLAGGE
ncbi:MAG TPA: tetratricopeptide repeat protein, partial [Terriglobales bacterium]|nr:tetratricopeptide repeat protein [Terriglobales bacterium]